MKRQAIPLEKLVKMACHCCGARARYQWNACADGNIWRPLCPRCDVAVNIAILRVLHPKRWRSKVRAYARRINFDPKKLEKMLCDLT